MIHFIKMHGLGNDFVIINMKTQSMPVDSEIFKVIADRRHGVGCDQCIVLTSGDGHADIAMDIYNADGSMAEACGNATRCVAYLEMEAQKSDNCTILINGNVFGAHRNSEYDPMRVSVSMGKPSFDWEKIPLARRVDTMAVPLGIIGLEVPVAVNIGNPHIVFFSSKIASIDVESLGPEIEHNLLFPERVNVGFAEIMSRDSISLTVWERGVGLTAACGTGACAAVAAAQAKDLVDDRVTVSQKGGDLVIHKDSEGALCMEGLVAVSFFGFFNLENDVFG
jgi:diaminopimelate epimerase